MAEPHPNIPLIMSMVAELVGEEAEVSIDDDGEVVVTQGGRTFTIAANDRFVVARSYWATEAPQNALAVIARVLTQRMAVGRLVYFEGGDRFILDVAQGVQAEVDLFTVQHVLETLIEVEAQVAVISEEYGYSI